MRQKVPADFAVTAGPESLPFETDVRLRKNKYCAPNGHTFGADAPVPFIEKSNKFASMQVYLCHGDGDAWNLQRYI
ncbi:hypothetical protein CCP1ISM_5650001 [Azospirillaceae bacterium]